METCENSDKSKSTWVLKRHSQQLALSLSRFGSQTEQALARKFENVGLKSNNNETTRESSGVDDSGLRLQPTYAEDCSFFLRTGKCKFGMNCRFNHPVMRENLVDQEIGTERRHEGFSGKSSQIACKYYLTAGGCKYGESCRFNHSKTVYEIAPLERNFLGLPLRLGEKECPFYMRNGSCRYGDCCRFHHPDPANVGGSDPYSSTLNGESVGYFCDASGIIDAESLLHLSGPSSAEASWYLPLITDKSVYYLDNHSFYTPATSLHPDVWHHTPEWSGYEVPNYSQERKPPRSVAAANIKMQEADLSKFEELPERPGQSECEHFIKTGDCKFKSACRYHHPKTHPPKKEFCVLNDKGLPLRPGKKICWHYENLGICKYGRACAFDHPVNQDSSKVPNGATSESPSGSGDNTGNSRND